MSTTEIRRGDEVWVTYADHKVRARVVWVAPFPGALMVVRIGREQRIVDDSRVSLATSTYVEVPFDPSADPERPKTMRCADCGAIRHDVIWFVCRACLGTSGNTVEEKPRAA